MRLLLLLKSHVKGYTKKDGTFVPEHETKTRLKQKQLALFKKPAGVIGAQYGGSAPKQWPAEEPHYPDAVMHPQSHDDGKPFQINRPSKPSPASSWADPDAIATFVPGGEVPAELNGVAFAEWEDAPSDIEGWDMVDGQIDLEEPPLPQSSDAGGKPKEQAAGVIIEEPDGRVWVMRPSNGFGGYVATFPKGRADEELGLQAVAIKEAFEETGLKVEITGYWGDIERTQTQARYYTARRVGGTPAAMGWEAQAVQLVPKDQLLDILNSPIDHKVVLMGGENWK